MANQIVTVNVSINGAPAPSNLQQTGAVVSAGGTTLTPGTFKLITQLSDLTAILTAAETITSVAWASGVVTVTAAADLPASLPIGATFVTTIAGMTPSGYNGQYVATVTGAGTFTYALATNPGSATVEGTFTLSDEVLSMATTYFAQGTSNSVYVLEVGDVSLTSQIAALGTFLTDNPQTIYSYLVPRAWDGNSAFLELMANYESPTSKTYFFITTTLATYSGYATTLKCAFLLVESPGKPAGEFSCAAPFWVTLNYNPSGASRITPLAFAFLYGVTAYPVLGNASTLAALQAANVNYVGTGAEGGLTNTILFWGTTLDGNDFTYWFSVDWIQINLNLNISNAIINGSNNTINPLYYKQDGINRLQDASVSTFQTAISYGLAIGTVARASLSPQAFTAALDAGTYAGMDVVNAVPFLTYTTLNPGDFPKGIYNGLAAAYIPSRGFRHIVFNLQVTDFLSE